MHIRDEEQYLINLLDEAKRLITGHSVIRENGLSRFKEQLKEDNMQYARSAGDVLYDKINERSCLICQY